MAFMYLALSWFPYSVPAFLTALPVAAQFQNSRAFPFDMLSRKTQTHARSQSAFPEAIRITKELSWEHTEQHVMVSNRNNQWLEFLVPDFNIPHLSNGRAKIEYRPTSNLGFNLKHHWILWRMVFYHTSQVAESSPTLTLVNLVTTDSPNSFPATIDQ